MAFVCTKKCYKGGKRYVEGETWIGKGQPDSKFFKEAKSGLTKPKKALEEKSTLSSIQRNKPDTSAEAIKAKRSLGHREEIAPARKDADDPFAETNDATEDDSFL